METSRENIINAYNVARQTGADSTCKVLEALYPDIDFTLKENLPVTDRIKTFGDAVEALGEDHPFVVAYHAVEDIEEWGADLEAYLKLRIITAALNEGWEPQFTEDEWRYYPWFYLWTNEELADKSDEWKRNHCLTTTKYHRGEWAGLAYAYSNSAPSATGANIGSRLCFKSDTLAEYAGKTFIDLWMDFYLIRK